MQDKTEPRTYEKALGHDILLNEEATVAPDHSDGNDGVVIPVRNTISFGIFLPRETGTFHRFQTDGMLMSHPTLEGTMVPLSTYNCNPGRLAEGNYLKSDNDETMELIWQDILSAIGITVEDVPAPDGYAQSQEGLRWIEVMEHDLTGRHNDWLRWHDETGRPVAIVYPNCD